MRRRFLLPALLLAVSAAHGQIVPLDPDWKEVEAPPPPALRRSGLIRLEIPGASLRYGVDPASVSVGSDGIVRYVVVASSSSGAVNAMYEGVRCGTGEFRVYARYNPDGGWTMARDSTWRPLHDQPSFRHSLLIARSGACLGHATNQSAEQVVRDLRDPGKARYSY